MKASPSLQAAVPRKRLSEVDEARIQTAQRPFFIEYPRALEILSVLEDAFNQTRTPRMENVLLHGVTNNGKSTIIEAFIKEHPASMQPALDAAHVPIVRMIAPDSASDVKFYEVLLGTVYAPMKLAPAASRRLQAVQVLRTIGTRMLVIDEFQQILTGGGNRQLAALNAVKNLAAEAEIAIVAVGVKKAEIALGLDGQMPLRFLTREELKPWTPGTRFSALLDTFDARLPLKGRSGLGQPALAAKIHGMTDGLLGVVAALLRKAAAHAIRNGEERITPSTLDALRWASPREITGRPPE